MDRTFKHPLARRATTANLRRAKGAEETVLVIVTTLELDAKAKGYNAKNVHRLQEAAESFLAETKGLSGYALINRPRDWDA